MSEALLHKIPPHSIEHEQAILSTCLQDNRNLTEITSILEPNDFYNPKHSTIFGVIVDLHASGERVDLLSVAKKIRTLGKMANVEVSEVAAMTNHSVVYWDQLSGYCYFIKEKRMMRDASMRALAIYQSCFDESNTIDDVSAMVDELGKSLTPTTTASDMTSLRDVIPSVLNEIGMRASGQITQGVKTYLRSVDANIGFIGNSDLMVIGARPGMGKTAFILSTAIRQAQNGVKVAVFSLEMSNEQLTYRILSQVMNLSLENTMKKSMLATELEFINRNLSKIDNLPIYLCDKAGLNIAQFRTRARTMRDLYGVQIIYVDYIQLIQGSQRGNRENEISEISRTLKVVAKELKIPIVALSQLSRNVETRTDKRPMLSDLRESGAIEQDADIVGFLYRSDYYDDGRDMDGNDTRGMAEFIIAKNRNGSMGISQLTFVPHIAQYTEIKSLQSNSVPF
jgi:replicative DNA helicase